MKPIDVNPSMYIDFNKGKVGPEFKVGDHVKISKYKNSFYKKLSSKLVWKSFFDRKVKSTMPWTYVISDLNGEKIVGTFYKKEL